MTQLLYFVDGKPRVSREQAVELGLGHAFPAGSGFVCSDFRGQGPGGQMGCVLGSRSERCGYYPDKQKWLRIPGQPLSVGFWTDARPTPADLQVADPLRGTPVKLLDGQAWIIPTARTWSDHSGGSGWLNCLPGTLTLDSNGQWITGGVNEKYRQLWEIATRWWEEVFRRETDETNSIRFDFHGAHDAAALVLSANYRIAKPEIALLGLFDDQYYAATEILNALIDWPTFLQWAKKNLIAAQSAGSSSIAGDQDTTPITSPPSATSGRSRRSAKKRRS